MNNTTDRNFPIETCPIRNVVARFGNKWSLRFNELNRLISDISTRILSGTLKTLEADGLISRKVYAQVPPKVEYRLTETGKSLIPIIMQLTAWAQENMQHVMKHRSDYENNSKQR